MALEVFISYSHKYEALRKKLETHLALMQREGLVESWTDRCITAGSRWRNQIDDKVRISPV